MPFVTIAYYPYMHKDLYEFCDNHILKLCRFAKSAGFIKALNSIVNCSIYNGFMMSHEASNYSPDNYICKKIIYKCGSGGIVLFPRIKNIRYKKLDYDFIENIDIDQYLESCNLNKKQIRIYKRLRDFMAFYYNNLGGEDYYSTKLIYKSIKYANYIAFKEEMLLYTRHSDDIFNTKLFKTFDKLFVKLIDMMHSVGMYIATDTFEIDEFYSKLNYCSDTGYLYLNSKDFAKSKSKSSSLIFQYVKYNNTKRYNCVPYINGLSKKLLTKLIKESNGNAYLLFNRPLPSINYGDYNLFVKYVDLIKAFKGKPGNVYFTEKTISNILNLRKSIDIIDSL